VLPAFRRATFEVTAVDGRPFRAVDGGLIAAAALGVAEYFTLTLAFGLLAAAALVAGMGGSRLAQILALRDRGWGGPTDRAAARETGR
jgi:hypothetical protein